MADELNRFRLPIKDVRPITDMPMDAMHAVRPDPAAPLRPPEGAPNVLLILIDYMGFGASSVFGGPCAMPTAERLADEGVRFSRFHTTALCSPTRQALLTGRNHHSVNMGAVAELATSMPGNTGVLPNDCATVAQMLRGNIGRSHDVSGHGSFYLSSRARRVDHASAGCARRDRPN